MKALSRYLRPYWGYLLLTVFIKLIGAATELLIPYLMELTLDDYVPAGDLGGIYLCGGGMLLCAAACLGANVLANRMSALSSGRITQAIRHDLFARLQTLSARQMDRLTVSSAESRLTSDTYNINQLLARTQRLGIRAPVLLAGGAAMMLSMDPVLALVLLAMLPVIGLTVYGVTKASVTLYTRQQGELDKVVRVARENITGIRVIKALSKTDYEKSRFRQVNGSLSELDRRASWITSLTNPTATLTLNLGLTLVVLVGAFRVNGGQSQGGVIVAFLQYFTMILNAMLGVTRIFVLWSKGEASARRVAQVLAEPEELAVQPAREPPEPDPPHIEFRHVSFSYTGVGENLRDLSFRLERGQTLGILGPTGAGKSTLVQLLLRFYDPTAGEILLDGVDLRCIPRETLRRKFGVVFQNDFVMEGTLGENLRFFRDIPDPMPAARAAQAEFITDPEAPVAVRGNNLSGGQKQRLLIGRALAGDPEILILDDASSALDYRTDARLRRALARDYSGATTVVVAQRVSSLRHADQILVLSDGAVAGLGTHQQLMASCPEYRSIARTQMGEGADA